MVENINHILYIKLTVNLDFSGVLYIFLKFCSIISGTQKKSVTTNMNIILSFLSTYLIICPPPPKKMKLNKITKTVEKK